MLFLSSVSVGLQKPRDALSAKVAPHFILLNSTIPLLALPQKHCCRYLRSVWLALGRGHHSKSEAHRREGLQGKKIPGSTAPREHALLSTSSTLIRLVFILHSNSCMRHFAPFPVRQHGNKSLPGAAGHWRACRRCRERLQGDKKCGRIDKTTRRLRQSAAGVFCALLTLYIIVLP